MGLSKQSEVKRTNPTDIQHAREQMIEPEEVINNPAPRNTAGIKQR